MGRVVITGADGFTGRFLAEHLCGAGYEVHGVVRSREVVAMPGADRLHYCDLADADGLARIMCEVRPTKVAHLAAIAFVAFGGADAMYETNLIGSRHVLEAIVAARAPVDAVLLPSSAHVYGNSQSEVLDENAPLAPVSDYAVSKLSMEYVARLYHGRLPIVVARPFNYTGRGQSLNFVIPKIVDHFRRRVSVLELGNLDVARDFSDVRSVADIYRRLMEAPAAIGEVFNVCSGIAYTLQEVLDMMVEISGSAISVEVNPAFVRNNEVKTLRGDCGKLESVIGTAPIVPLKETLRWMFEN